MWYQNTFPDGRDYDDDFHDRDTTAKESGPLVGALHRQPPRQLTRLLAGFLRFMIYARLRCAAAARVTEELACDPTKDGQGSLESTATKGTFARSAKKRRLGPQWWRSQKVLQTSHGSSTPHTYLHDSLHPSNASTAQYCLISIFQRIVTDAFFLSRCSHKLRSSHCFVCWTRNH